MIGRFTICSVIFMDCIVQVLCINALVFGPRTKRVAEASLIGPFQLGQRSGIASIHDGSGRKMVLSISHCSVLNGVSRNGPDLMQAPFHARRPIRNPVECYRSRTSQRHH
jgi:hypothetical protein